MNTSQQLVLPSRATLAQHRQEMLTLAGMILSMCSKPRQTAEMNASCYILTKIWFFLGICPSGYTPINENLSGSGMLWALPNPDPSRTLQQCADICNNRSGCTSFEYSNGPQEQGACGTYTGGDSNIRENENRTQPGSNWFSCVRIGEGLYFIQFLLFQPPSGRCYLGPVVDCHMEDISTTCNVMKTSY